MTVYKWTLLSQDFRYILNAPLSIEDSFYQDANSELYFWGGASDEGREGQWYWTHSLAPVDPVVWAPGKYTYTIYMSEMLTHQTTWRGKIHTNIWGSGVK